MLSGAIFDVANKIEQIKDDEAKTLAPDFWNDQLKAQALMKEIKQKKHLRKKLISNIK